MTGKIKKCKKTYLCVLTHVGSVISNLITVESWCCNLNWKRLSLYRFLRRKLDNQPYNFVDRAQLFLLSINVKWNNCIVLFNWISKQFRVCLIICYIKSATFNTFHMFVHKLIHLSDLVNSTHLLFILLLFINSYNC